MKRELLLSTVAIFRVIVWGRWAFFYYYYSS